MIVQFSRYLLCLPLNFVQSATFILYHSFSILSRVFLKKVLFFSFFSRFFCLISDSFIIIAYLFTFVNTFLNIFSIFLTFIYLCCILLKFNRILTYFIQKGKRFKNPLPFFILRCLLKLTVVKVGIKTAFCNKLIMISAFYDISVFHNEYQIRIFNGRKPVGYYK